MRLALRLKFSMLSSHVLNASASRLTQASLEAGASAFFIHGKVHAFFAKAELVTSLRGYMIYSVRDVMRGIDNLGKRLHFNQM